MESGKKCCPAEILSRLKKIEGQVRGVIRMIEDERGCEVKAAINQVGVRVVIAKLATCLEETGVAEEQVKRSVEKMAPLLRKAYM